MLVIVTGIIVNWALPLMQHFFSWEVSADALRVFRKVPIFREAWLLIRGLKDSIRTLFWTCVVICLVTYAFAIFGLVTMVVELQKIESVTTDQESLDELAELMPYMDGLGRLMFTLCQVLTQDSFHSFVRLSSAYVFWSWMYFYLYVAISCFVLMNL